MEQVGLRELRQNASELIRRVEAGEQITITVSGRPSAKLVPTKTDHWRTWEEIAPLFQSRPDLAWDEDRDLVCDEIRDPWANQ